MSTDDADAQIEYDKELARALKAFECIVYREYPLDYERRALMLRDWDQMTKKDVLQFELENMINHRAVLDSRIAGLYSEIENRKLSMKELESKLAGFEDQHLTFTRFTDKHGVEPLIKHLAQSGQSALRSSLGLGSQTQKLPDTSSTSSRGHTPDHQPGHGARGDRGRGASGRGRRRGAHHRA